MNTRISSFTKNRFIALLAAALISLSGVYYYTSFYSAHNSTAQGTYRILDFDDARDTQALLELFNQNWYWLISSDDYSPSYALKYRAPNRDPQYMGAMTIKVLYEGRHLAGFTSYYLKSKDEGMILFLGVNKEFRRKQYGRTLINYAIEQLFAQGVKTVKLLTRASNHKAQALYRSVGFIDDLTEQHEGFVYFVLPKK